MNRILEIDLDHNEGALLRILGTVERRGFAVLELNADKPDADSYSLRLQLAGERDPQVLCRQLQRLIDVRAVRLLPDADAIAQNEPPAPCFQATWLSNASPL
jgi:acetolactate synthase regulatory subunit